MFCIRPTLIYAFEFDTIWEYIGFFPTDTEMAVTLYLSSAGLIVFCSAFTLTTPYPGPREFSTPREFTPSEKKSFWAMTVLFVPAGLYSIFGAAAEGEHVDGVFIITGTSGYLNDLQQVLIPITVLILVVSRWRYTRSFRY